jgi:hypothetical protein
MIVKKHVSELSIVEKSFVEFREPLYVLRDKEVYWLGRNDSLVGNGENYKLKIIGNE